MSQYLWFSRLTGVNFVDWLLTRRESVLYLCYGNVTRYAQEVKMSER